MAAINSIPLRTCLGCRLRRAKPQLVRYVLSDNIVIVDRGQKRPGRGAYVCDSADCLSRSITTHAFDKAFRQHVIIDKIKLTGDTNNG